jgi:hypothetical protein
MEPLPSQGVGDLSLLLQEMKSTIQKRKVINEITVALIGKCFVHTKVNFY